MPERLERSVTNRRWAGVAGGIAEYFQVDATLVRVFFVIATIVTAGLFLLVYIALIVIMPLPGRAGPFDAASAPTTGTSSTGSSGTSTDPNATRPLVHYSDPEAAARRREGAGWLLVALGVIFLLANVGAFRFVDFRYIWPIALIALGAFIIIQRSRQ